MEDTADEPVDDFNSHAHVERDAHFCLTEYRTCISTHTLTWSVTIAVVGMVAVEVFQLTRSRGA